MLKERTLDIVWFFTNYGTGISPTKNRAPSFIAQGWPNKHFD